MASVQVDRLQKKQETRPVFLPWQQLLGKRVGDTRPQRRAAGTFSSRRKLKQARTKGSSHTDLTAETPADPQQNNSP